VDEREPIRVSAIKQPVTSAFVDAGQDVVDRLAEDVNHQIGRRAVSDDSGEREHATTAGAPLSDPAGDHRADGVGQRVDIAARRRAQPHELADEQGVSAGPLRDSLHESRSRRSGRFGQQRGDLVLVQRTYRDGVGVP
jgi:hypothetical protein